MVLRRYLVVRLKDLVDRLDPPAKPLEVRLALDGQAIQKALLKYRRNNGS